MQHSKFFFTIYMRKKYLKLNLNTYISTYLSILRNIFGFIIDLGKLENTKKLTRENLFSKFNISKVIHLYLSTVNTVKNSYTYHKNILH